MNSTMEWVSKSLLRQHEAHFLIRIDAPSTAEPMCGLLLAYLAK
jgi:hypothetical protein